MGDGDGAAGEVFDHGTYEEDGTVTRETLMFPRYVAAYGEPHPNLQRPRVCECTRKPVKNKALAAR